MNLAIIGCGFVADYYLATLPLHPELRVLGLMDVIEERAKLLSGSYGIHRYNTLPDALGDDRVDLVLNLTSVVSHYEVSRAALLAGKHVYTEKPMALRFSECEELVVLAASRGLTIASAPCSLLGETAQTMWRLLREQVVGRVRVVYAEMDDGLVPQMPYHAWKSISGVPWPYKDEFEMGCTLEHAGYQLSWLAAWFGPAVSVTSFASVQYPDKLGNEPLSVDSPDFSVACIQFASGVVARLTCSILSPKDHSLKIVGDRGILYTHDSWDFFSPVYTRRLVSIRRKTFLSPMRRKHALRSSAQKTPKKNGAQRMDFARGPAEMAAALLRHRVPRLSPHFSLHVNEMALAIHWSRQQGASYRMTTTFDPIEPMPWAE